MKQNQDFWRLRTKRRFLRILIGFKKIRKILQVPRRIFDDYLYWKMNSSKLKRRLQFWKRFKSLRCPSNIFFKSQCEGKTIIDCIPQNLCHDLYNFSPCMENQISHRKNSSNHYKIKKKNNWIYQFVNKNVKNIAFIWKVVRNMNFQPYSSISNKKDDFFGKKVDVLPKIMNFLQNTLIFNETGWILKWKGQIFH